MYTSCTWVFWGEAETEHNVCNEDNIGTPESPQISMRTRNPVFHYFRKIKTHEVISEKFGEELIVTYYCKK